jgi:hypothetical protein
MNDRHLRRDGWLVLGLALLVRVLAALPQAQPNYMDAAYYLIGGQRLVQGYGFNDPYIWNYLDRPLALPQPSHLYWMPLPSILAAISQWVFGVNYRAAQIPFVLLSSLLPLMAYTIAWRSSASRRHAWLAALFTIFSPFYLPYWGVPESFAPFAVFGAWALLLNSQSANGSIGRLVPAGMCAGLAHLSRADGVLLLAPMLVNVEFRIRTSEWQPWSRQVHIPKLTFRIRSYGAILIGYLLVMSPWFIRNVAVIGAPLSPAGAQAMWVCNYDELFSYNVQLDFSHLIDCGLDRVMVAKIDGIGSGIVHLIAEDGMIFLAPFIAVGLWKLRRVAVFRSAIVYGALLFAAMTIVFTFAGDRGGLFHSSSALLPFLYAAAPIGLDAAINRIAARRRTWDARLARSVFGAAAIGLAVLLGLMIYRGRVIGSNASDPGWNQADRIDQTLGQWLRDRGDADPIVMVNNPPMFYYQTGLRSIVIPNGNVDTLVSAARQFGAQWIVLDVNRPAPLADLYADPSRDPRLRWRVRFEGVNVLEVIAP